MRLRFGALAFLAIMTVALWAVHLGPLYGPTTSSDDMRYVGTAVAPYESPNVASRYAHIYGIRALYLILGSGMLAGAVHGLFHTTLLALVAFSFARNLCNSMAGLLAAAVVWCAMILFSPPTIAFPDLSMVGYGSVSLWFAWRLVRGETRCPWLILMVVGVFFVLAVRSKETGISLLPALLWLILRKGDGFELARLRPFALGMGLGVGILVGCDAAFLADALFGVRPSTNWAQFTWNLPATRALSKRSGSYAEVLTAAPVLAFAALTCLALVTVSTRSRLAKACVMWSLCALTLHGLLLVPARHTPYARYMISVVWPVIPLIGVFIAEVLGRARTRGGEDRKGGATLFLLLLVLALALLGLTLGWGLKVVFERLVPVLILVAGMWAVWDRQRSWVGSVVVVAVLLAALGASMMRAASHQQASFRRAHASWAELARMPEFRKTEFEVLRGSRMYWMLPHKLTILTGHRHTYDDLNILDAPGDLGTGRLLLTSAPLSEQDLETVIGVEDARFGSVWAYRGGSR